MLIMWGRLAFALPLVAWGFTIASAQSLSAVTPTVNSHDDPAPAAAPAVAPAAAARGAAPDSSEEVSLAPRAIRLNGQVQFRVDDPVKLAPVLTGSSQYHVRIKNRWWFDFQINATLQAPPGAVEPGKLVSLSKLNGATSSIDMGFLLAYRYRENWGGFVRFGGSANFQIAQLTPMDSTVMSHELYGYGQADVTAAATLGSVSLAAIGKYQKVSKGTPQTIKDAYAGNEDSLSFLAILPLQFMNQEDKTFFLNVQWDPFSSADALSIGFSLDFVLDKTPKKPR